jgi:hypothetical protein
MASSQVYQVFGHRSPVFPTPFPPRLQGTRKGTRKALTQGVKVPDWNRVRSRGVVGTGWRRAGGTLPRLVGFLQKPPPLDDSNPLPTRPTPVLGCKYSCLVTPVLQRPPGRPCQIRVPRLLTTNAGRNPSTIGKNQKYDPRFARPSGASEEMVLHLYYPFFQDLRALAP